MEAHTNRSGAKPFIDPNWIDFVLEHVDPMLSVSRTRARITAIVYETADIRTFVLRPNRHFRGFAPGQYVPVRVTLGGVVHERCYSLTGPPGAPTLSITVKRVEGGVVSTWLHDHARPGDVVELGDADGSFTLPDPLPAKLLFIAGGSGVTPVCSLIRAALHSNPRAEIALLYFARSASDFAFGDLFEGLASVHPGFQYIAIAEVAGPNTPIVGRFDAEQLRRFVPDYADREAFLCGPPGLMRAVRELFDTEGRRDRLRSESFGPAPHAASELTDAPVTFRRSQRTVVNNRANLLETAEAAGLKPANGCRIGICKTCVCTKVSGVVRDRVTGALDHEANSRIRICVSEPVGPVTLEL